MAKEIRADWKTFIKFWSVPLILVLVLAMIGLASTGLIIIGASVFLALALRPLVRRVNNFFTKHFGRDDKHQTVSVIFAYLIVVLVIGAIIAIIGPVVVNETSKFISNFPTTFEHTLGGWDGINSFGKNFGINDLHGEIINGMNNISNDLLGFVGNNLMSSVSGVADIVMKIALILVLTLLILLEGPELADRSWRSLESHSDNSKAVKVARRATSRMANVVSTYVSRQVMVAALDGCASAAIVFVLSLIFGFSSTLAVPMGMITMLFYLIPMFGQFIGGTLVTVLLFFSSPVAGGIFAIVYILYSQIENNVISPKIQGNALNLSPLIILCAAVVGMYMFGLLGAIISIPIAGCIRVLVEEYPDLRAARK